jgi:hypothetical protein
MNWPGGEASRLIACPLLTIRLLARERTPRG